MQGYTAHHQWQLVSHRHGKEAVCTLFAFWTLTDPESLLDLGQRIKFLRDEQPVPDVFLHNVEYGEAKLRNVGDE